MSEMWLDTLLLMVLGMGTVFIFLLLLIVSVLAMTAIIQRISPVATETTDHTIAIAAVAAAAHHHHSQSTHV